MHRNSLFLAVALVAWLSAAHAAHAADADPAEAARVEFFEKRIRPILVDHCYTCHSADTNSQGGLRVDDRGGLMTGGVRGPAVVPGQPDKSLLITSVAYTDPKFRMPPNEQLSPEQVADLTKWIEEGAAWPKVELPDDLGVSAAEYEELKKTHWAWQPLRVTSPPDVKEGRGPEAAWVRDDLDRYVLAALEQKGLSPVGDADKITLIRRVTFDLTGLPPSPEEIDAFVADPSNEAFSHVVDRLLASQAYGERWGRHWLDVARYGESTGSARNLPYPHAWRYRDYVINAFNNDKPYNQFLREQIAGDLLPANSPHEKAEQLVATGFLALGVKDVNQRFKVRYIMDNVDEQIDTVSRAVLGLTVSCARCHDHKFDPIPTTDYYALAGIFRSTDICAGLRNKMGGGGLDYYDTKSLLFVGMDLPQPASQEQIADAQKVFEAAKAEFDAIFNKPEGKALAPDGKPKQFHARQKMQQAEQELLKLTDPAASGMVALGVRDAKTVSDTEIRVRGEAEKLGPSVPRGYLSLLEVPHAPPINPEQSGRLELARWLSSAENPLTSRVMVNRIWHHLFGKGLVQTVDNFGVTGDSPSHPELLDHLATRFVNDGWSVKKLVRAIALSHAYQLSAAATDAHLAVDPANRFLWRHSPRRLDAEEIRDAMLAASGKLDLARPEASPAKSFKVIELTNDGPEARSLRKAAQDSLNRSVYLPLLRGLTPRSLEVFDFAEQGMVTGSRDATTVAPQALYLLNDPFVCNQSLALAERLLSQKDMTDAWRAEVVYRRILGRSPTTQEVERSLAYVADYQAAAQQVLVSAPANPSNQSSSDSNAEQPPPTNPDDVKRNNAANAEEINPPHNPQEAAWASLCQALLGTAEFRYLR